MGKPKPNDKCFCRSGKKYKKCHKFREFQKPLQPHEVEALKGKVRSDHAYCLHPDASPQVCGSIIRAHSIQRKGPLAAVCDKGNELWAFAVSPAMNGGTMKRKKMGWKGASTYRCMCGIHDASLYDEIDNQPFTGTIRQVFLVSFRSLIAEMFLKKAVLAELPRKRKFLDRGRNQVDQIDIQNSLNLHEDSNTIGLADLERMYKEFKMMYRTQDFSGLEYVCIQFTGTFCLAFSGSVNPEFDVLGKRIQNLMDNNSPNHSLFISNINVAGGGQIVIGWLKEDVTMATFVKSLVLSPLEKISWFLPQWVFGFIENTYHSSAWWEGLSEAKKKYVEKLCGSFHLNTLPEPGVKLTDWKVTGYSSNCNF